MRALDTEQNYLQCYRIVVHFVAVGTFVDLLVARLRLVRLQLPDGVEALLAMATLNEFLLENKHSVTIHFNDVGFLEKTNAPPNVSGDADRV